MNSYCVYLLINTLNNYTYLGITNNIEKRLRQHNGIISGGAKYTKSFKQDGEWKYYLVIPNLSKSLALLLERSIKNRRFKSKGKTSLDKRLYCINETIKNYKDLKYNIF